MRKITLRNAKSQAAIIVALLASFLLVSAKQTVAQAAPPADLDAFVARSMKTFDVPGMAIGIVKDGKLVIAKGYGVRKMGGECAGG